MKRLVALYLSVLAMAAISGYYAPRVREWWEGLWR